MRYIRDCYTFRTTIEPIDANDGKIYSIQPCYFSGRFLPHRAQELVEYCKKNPGFHIATELGNYTTINKFIENGYRYYLCLGDADPDIIFFDEHYLNYVRTSDIAEFIED